MTLQFPPTPGIGQIYNGSNNVIYVWDGVKWQAIGSGGSGGGGGGGPGIGSGGSNATVSSFPPINATMGTLWFNSGDGRLYVYYDDGSSHQWIDVTGA